MKKTLSMILSLVMLTTSILCFGTTAFGATTVNDSSFNLNSNVKATFTSKDKILTIDGKGDTGDYDLSPFVQKDFSSYIEKIVIGDGITKLGNNLFGGLINVETVVIPDTLTTIGSRVFQGCPRIKEINIPASVTHIDPTGIRTASESVATQLEKINVDEGNKNYCDINGVLYNKDKTTLISVPSSWTGEKLEIPETVTSFVDQAGINCRLIKEIVIPRNINIVGSKTFKMCKNLELVTIYSHDVELHKESEIFDGANKLKITGFGDSTAKIFAQEIGVEFITMNCDQHKPVADKGYAPTCTKDGLTDGSHCSVCGTVVKTQKPISKKGHSYKSTSKLTRATEKADGKNVTTYTCKDCGNSYSKTTKVYYKINSIKLNYSSLVYNGKTRNVDVTIKDRKGNTLKKDRDYTVSWSKGRKDVGRYTCKVTFKGNYSGSKILYLTIKPKETALTKVTGASKGFKAYWKKQTTQTTGYHIEYATNKAFTQNAKGIFVKGNKTTSKSIGKLKSKKGYYVRVRTYKTVKFNGRNVNIYSNWSKAIYVKTK